jgi:hypothetical protein
MIGLAKGIRGIAVSCGAVALAASILVAPTAQAAPKKPGLCGPTQVTVGQEVTFTSVFNGAVKKNGCFTSIFDFSDQNGGQILISDGICLKSSKKPVFKKEVDKNKHVFQTPGIYEVTVDAAGRPNGGGGLSKKNALVKGGPKSYSLTVTVSPDPSSDPNNVAVVPTPSESAAPQQSQAEDTSECRVAKNPAKAKRLAESLVGMEVDERITAIFREAGFNMVRTLSTDGVPNPALGGLPLCSSNRVDLET